MVMKHNKWEPQWWVVEYLLTEWQQEKIRMVVKGRIEDVKANESEKWHKTVFIVNPEAPNFCCVYGDLNTPGDKTY